MPVINEKIPMSLYVHIPWCVRKCPYCDFNSHAVKGELPEQHYIDCLSRDLAFDLEHFKIKRPLQTIFIGGGTPSLFSATAIEQLLKIIDQQLGIANDVEITLEANPGTVEQQRFADYRAAGINRLSLGVQSFQSDKLQRLGRIHDGEEAIAAVSAIKKVGFDNFNIDLMFGLPNQSIDDGLFDLTTAIELAPTHLSWYQLTLEPNTIFYKKPPKLPNEDLIATLQDAGQALLAQHGFKQYEISAYSQDNWQCRHNVNYWNFGDYVGIGAGAHGKITQEDGSVIRTRKVKQPESYMNATDFNAEMLIIEKMDLAFEYMINALRLNKPVELKHFTIMTGLPIDAIERPLKVADEKKLIVITKTHIYKTLLGERFLNDLLELFLP
jgi:putative oxygen-independent coproporphyrinogen III oxidase